jgi:hypothetical protein
MLKARNDDIPSSVIFEHVCKRLLPDYSTFINVLIALGKEYVNEIDIHLFQNKIKKGHVVWVKHTNLYMLITNVTRGYVFLEHLSVEYAHGDFDITCHPWWPLRPLRLGFITQLEQLAILYQDRRKKLRECRKIYRLKSATRLSVQKLKLGLVSEATSVEKWNVMPMIQFKILSTYDEISHFRNMSA